MLKLLCLSTIQCALLASCQIFLKLALLRMAEFTFTIAWFKAILTNWYFALSVLSIAIASVLWMYILKNYELSIAYPLVAISYVFGMLAAAFIFHEAIPLSRWIGVGFIIVGVIFVVK